MGLPRLPSAWRRLPPACARASLRLQRPRGFPLVIPACPFCLAWSTVLLYQQPNPYDAPAVERQAAFAARGLRCPDDQGTRRRVLPVQRGIRLISGHELDESVQRPIGKTA
jgi:hypothetical protein